MERDRTETSNLAARHPGRVRSLANTWDRWAQDSYVDAWPELAPREDWGAPSGQENAAD
jgi:hypothetical protein